MFLRSLTIRGFKSFPDRTELTFEPGVTIVVGPNGSGKSNIVDAISWVLGEQGPSSLRGGRMEDVIFAGSRKRPALGMAEVSLTIDNTAGLLPIAFSEVTISRVLFRSGDSEYRLNGQAVRLMDISELLSDTGVGREQHTIIGQGQLDQVLTADPADIRAFIEEAAGVGKHRRRKERALRKIAASEQNLVRLSDLLSEIRRQLRPLREQAEVASRHQKLNEDLDRVRLVLASRELSLMREGLGSAGASLDASIRLQEDELASIETRLRQAEISHHSTTGEANAQREASWDLGRSEERLGMISWLARERRGALEARLESSSEANAAARIEAANARVQTAGGQLTEAEEVCKVSTEKSLDAQSALEAADEDLRRASGALESARLEHRGATSDHLRIQSEISAAITVARDAEANFSLQSSRADAADTSLIEATARLSSATQEIQSHEREFEPLEIKLREVEDKISAAGISRLQLAHRLEAAERFALTLAERARLGAATADSADFGPLLDPPGVVGVLGDLADAESHATIQSVFGDPRRILVVSGRDAALSVMASLQSSEGIQVVIRGPRQECEGLPAVSEVIPGVFVAPDYARAVELSAKYPAFTFVTSGGFVARGSHLSQVALDAREAERTALDEAANLRRVLEEHDLGAERLAADRDKLVRSVNRADAAITAATEMRTTLDRDAHALSREVQITSEVRAAGVAALSAVKDRLQKLQEQVPALEESSRAAEDRVAQLQTDHAQVLAARQARLTELHEARVTFGTAEGRLASIKDEMDAAEAALSAAKSDATGLTQTRASLETQIEKMRAVVSRASSASEIIHDWALDAEDRFRALKFSLEGIEQRLEDLRAQRHDVAAKVDELRAAAREEDLSTSEMRVRSRVLEERMRDEWRFEPDEAVTKFGHQWEVEDPSKLQDPLAKLAIQDEESLRRRLGRLERDLLQMGAVNALAAQEFDALSAREEFLTGQIADLRSSRRDLFKVVASVDDEIRKLFSSAFDDVSREYEKLFSMLFPGGTGRLRLSDQSDLLTSGVEVEARPGGKNLKRLSLLSGGERALSALAFLFAIFSARPSPFYILDEVEAALDDINLSRFLGLVRRFKESSQLLVVTHQKRTMEAADILYGVSIRPDGASRVISQRMNEALRGPLTLSVDTPV